MSTPKTPLPPLDNQLSYNVYALNLAFGRLHQMVFADTGFTYPKFVILSALRESGPMSLTDLSAQVGTEANSLSPLVKKLSSFGLIDRVRDPDDERRVLLTLLPYGETMLQTATEAIQQALETLDLDTLVSGTTCEDLARVRAAVENAKDVPKMVVPPAPDGQAD